MITRVVLCSAAFLLAGCSPPSSATDAGTAALDATNAVDGGVGQPDSGTLPDAGTPFHDGGIDGGSTDAGTPETDAGTLGTYADLEQTLCQDIPAFICESATNCGCIVPSGDVVDATTCTTQRREQCVQQLQVFQQPIADGLVVVLKDRLAQCLARYHTVIGTCEAPLSPLLIAECDPVVSTTVRLGESCTEPICDFGRGYCDNNGICQPVPGPGGSCTRLCQVGSWCREGTCTAFVAENGACTTREDCAPPLQCLNNTCTSLVTENGACTDTAQCAAGLECSNNVCTAPGACSTHGQTCANLASCAVPVDRRCATREPEGAACQQNSDCADGLYCDNVTTTCTTLPGGGSACGNGVSCAAGLGCHEQSTTCETLPGDGASCALGPEGPFLCAAGLGCLNGVCGPLPVQGEECAIPNTCAPEYACDFTPEGSVCATRRGDGAACQNDQICESGLFCDYAGNSTCTPARPTGAACSSGNECGSDAVCLPGGSGYQCAPMPQQGESCLFDCAAGLYCRANLGEGRCVPELCSAVTGS
ncbi:MAG: Dickkopf N-terminal cysteine-rich domain-containing protein [Myxococcota bacterium]